MQAGTHSGAALYLPARDALINSAATGILGVDNSWNDGQDHRQLEIQSQQPLLVEYNPPTPSLSVTSTPSVVSPVCATPDLAADAPKFMAFAFAPVLQNCMDPVRVSAVAGRSALSPARPTTKKRKAEGSKPPQALKAAKSNSGDRLRYICPKEKCNGYKTDVRNDWRRHEKSARHGGPGVNCDVCGKHFSRDDAVKRHKQKKH